SRFHHAGARLPWFTSSTTRNLLSLLLHTPVIRRVCFHIRKRRRKSRDTCACLLQLPRPRGLAELRRAFRSRFHFASGVVMEDDLGILVTRGTDGSAGDVFWTGNDN